MKRTEKRPQITNYTVRALDAVTVTLSRLISYGSLSLCFCITSTSRTHVFHGFFNSTDGCTTDSMLANLT